MAPPADALVAPGVPVPATAGSLGQAWQWAAAVLVAGSIALGSVALRSDRPPSVTSIGPTPSADRREVVVTAMAAPMSSTRVAVAATRPAVVPTAVAPRPPRAPTLVVSVEARAANPTEATRTTGAPVGAVAREARPTNLPLRGIGYNPIYATADVPGPVRSDRLERDMRLMASVGINMVLGWEPGVFDERLLAAAQANGISVILPFDLKPEWDYADPDLRQDVMTQITAWVTRYRHQPSIVMWGVGNEVTLDMDDAQRRAFAQFYVEAFELVRALDPTRPVTLREAEDVLAPYLAEAFGRRQGVWRDPPTATATPEEEATDAATEEATPPGLQVVVAPSGFVYGVNFYTDRVGPALNDWVANTGLDVPLLVSEYAPAGMSRIQRPLGFAHMYGLIEAAAPRVIGSAPYTWTTLGPEGVDAYFGIVDGEGRPVDGTVAELARMYGVEPPVWARAAPVAQELASAAELPRLYRESAVVGARLTGQEPADILAATDTWALRAEEEMEVLPEQQDDGSARVREIARLIGWARELSELRAPTTDETLGKRLFPGMREALPLLRGMARWSRFEQSAVDTARDFMAAVLRRDLATLAAG